MLKDFLENCKRVNSDNQENNSRVMVYENGQFVATAWKKLLTGDIIKLNRGDYIPADLLLVYSTGEKADCFVETKNLDGETNLKMKSVPTVFRDKIKTDREVQSICNIRMQYEEPNPFLYTFDGFMIVEGQSVPIDPKNILLRGSNLRNTGSIFGVVIFTGHFTKIMMNSVKAKPKRSHLESKMGWQILTVFFLLVAFDPYEAYLLLDSIWTLHRLAIKIQKPDTLSEAYRHQHSFRVLYSSRKLDPDLRVV